MRPKHVSRNAGLIFCASLLMLLSGCSFFGDVSKQAQEEAGKVQKTVGDTIDKTGKTLNEAKTKVENVTNAAGNLQKSLNDLNNWSGNGNKNS